MMSYGSRWAWRILGAFLVYGTLEPGAIVEAQGPNPLNWGSSQPLGLVLFFTAAIAETKRAPFDIPEGEPEIIGYFVEYSGMRFGMFFLAEFIEIVFLVGGHRDGVLRRLAGARSSTPTASTSAAHAARSCRTSSCSCCRSTAFGFKVFFLCWFQLMIRWTLPRFRADQLMDLGWKLLLPLSLANILVTAGVVLAISKR